MSRTRTSVVLGNGITLRAEARAAYEKVRRDLASVRQQIDQFKTKDRPQFARWMARQFAPMISEMRELEARLAYNRQLLFEIESECFWTGSSYIAGYERVMRRRQSAQSPSEGNPERESDSSRDTGPGSGRARGEEHSFHHFSSGGGDPHHRAGSDPGVHEPRPRHNSARLKELYRALVRKLHPDTNNGISPEQVEWWHEVQEAYEAGDVERLEAIFTLCAVEEKEQLAQTSVSLLTRITRELKAALTALRRELGQYRFDPAWNFSQRPERTTLERTIQRKLESDLRLLRQQVEFIEHQIQLLAAQSARAQRRRPPRPRDARRGLGE